MLRKSLALEIHNFWDFLGFKRSQKFTKSAFVQARKKIKPEVFQHLSQELVNQFYTDNDLAIKKWKGYRLLAVDGSRITLPTTDELRQLYGEAKNHTKTGVVQARCSVIYDVANNFVLDGKLAPLKQGERELALTHFKHCQNDDLIIYDRGYPSYDFIYEHISKKIDYLMRVKISFSKLIRDFEKSKKPTTIISIFPTLNSKLSSKAYDKDTPIPVRLVRVHLPNGGVEILMTSLMDLKAYPNTDFKELYYKRWRVETFYDEFKNKLKVEYFSGYSNQSILQDFYSALFISNIQTLIVSELEDEIAETNFHKKYDYKINTNLSYGFLKNRILEIFFLEDSMSKAVGCIKELFLENQIPIRPDRTFERDSGKYRTRIKPKVTKNQKDAI